MKKLLFFSLLLAGIMSFSASLAQPPMGPPEGPPDGPPGRRIADRMALFIERKMRLSERERVEFTPLFIRYEKEYRDILRSNRQDRLVLQQQLIDLQLRYRKEFGPVVGNRRVMEIYDLQQYFIRTLRDLQQERRGGPGARRPF
ncbi:MAG: hypothetical protein FJ348_04515 [Sphingomonadales bacterium]|nr:hypothetical protein [Sphingomonadales bacterium]